MTIDKLALGGGSPVSLIDRKSQPLPPGCVTQAAERWREAARVATARWEVFLGAEHQTRAFAFASYNAALDTEESAAATMARLVTSHIA